MSTKSAGRVSGTIVMVHTSDFPLKGYTRWAAAIVLAVCSWIASAQEVEAFRGLKPRYSKSDTVEFQVINRSPQILEYVVILERKARDDNWWPIYQSLSRLVRTMYEPKMDLLRPGEAVDFHWVPANGEWFVDVTDGVAAAEHRLVLRATSDRFDSSKTFRLASDVFVIE